MEKLKKKVFGLMINLLEIMRILNINLKLNKFINQKNKFIFKNV